MKIVILQPPYPTEGTMDSAGECIRWMQDKLEALKPGEQDLVLLPEYANVPGIADRESMRQFAVGRGADFVRAITTEAGRLECTIVPAIVVQSESRWFNRTLLIDSNGDIVFTYDKVHLTDAERDLGLSPGTEPRVIEHAGFRLGFATCFDLYFPEHFETLAALQADIVLCPSYQRSESAQRIRLIAQARALDTGAYLARSAYSMADATRGGCSLIAAPTGDVLADADGKSCVLITELDPAAKFIKPASHGQPAVEHRTLIESHRMPSAYRERRERVRHLTVAQFPRLCAHRGLSICCPENTLPAFAAAVAAGADEIELDLKLSSDGVPVVCHDETVDRTTNGHGRISEMTWDDIRKLDAGVRHARHDAGDRLREAMKWSETWRGTRIPRFEEVLEVVDGRIGLNIHINDAGPDGRLVKMVCDILRKEALLDIAYIAGGTEPVLRTAREYAPEVPCASLLGQRGDIFRQIELAREFDCQRIQMLGDVTESHIRRAHDEGLICNYFWSDDITGAREYIRKGIDVILTNCAHTLIADGFDALRRTPIG
ncbi:MAG: hypothetical protein GX811_13985 [Lentisphaerae bacterium]|nr:hypothetical protein [Lentisphaerota bacterium]